MQIDGYMTPDEMASMRGIRLRSFLRVTVETLEFAIGAMASGDARENLERLLVVAREFKNSNP